MIGANTKQTYYAMEFRTGGSAINDKMGCEEVNEFLRILVFYIIFLLHKRIFCVFLLSLPYGSVD